jgi:hypothetical protein
MTNLSPPFPGVVYATRDKKFGWIRQTVAGAGWEAHEVAISAVADVKVPLGEERMKTASHLSPTSLRLNADGKRAFVMFMGIIPERFQTSGLDRVLGKLPAFHGEPIGMFYTVAKSLYQQRGSLGRSRAALAFWTGLFAGQIDLEAYELGVLKRLRDIGPELSEPSVVSTGHLANAFCIDPDEADIKTAVSDQQLIGQRRRFEAAELLEVIVGRVGDESTPLEEITKTMLNACDELVGKFNDSGDPWLKAAVGSAGVLRGVALMVNGEDPAALTQFDTILESVGDSDGWLPAQARLGRASILNRQDRDDEAIAELMRLLDSKWLQDDPDASGLRSQAFVLRDHLRSKLKEKP